MFRKGDNNVNGDYCVLGFSAGSFVNNIAICFYLWADNSRSIVFSKELNFMKILILKQNSNI